MTIKRRIETLELATGPTETEDETWARTLQEMPYDELERRAREILARRDPPATDDMSEGAVMERKVRTLMARRDSERAGQ